MKSLWKTNTSGSILRGSKRLTKETRANRGGHIGALDRDAEPVLVVVIFFGKLEGWVVLSGAPALFISRFATLP
eukprot:scaffold689_cov186-Amphora_coffeaeformis.AAC.13